MYKYLSDRKEYASQNNTPHLCILNIDYHICASLRTSPLIVQQNKYLNYNGLYELLGLMWCERGDLNSHESYLSLDFKSSASTDSATLASNWGFNGIFEGSKDL